MSRFQPAGSVQFSPGVDSLSGGGLLDGAGRGSPAPSTPAPGGRLLRGSSRASGPFDDRLRISFHEAGHAVARSVLAGGTVNVASIRPGAAHGGVMIPGGEAFDGDLPDGLPETFDWPEGFRRHLEARIVVTLAGTIAEHLVPHSGYCDDSPDLAPAEQAARALAELSPRHREMLLESEADEHPTPDEDAAEKLSWALAGDEAMYHLAWLRAITARLVRQYAAAIGRVAQALVKSEVLDGDAIEALIHPPKEVDASILSKLRRPAPEPSYAGVNGPRIVQPLTIDHPHVRVVTRDFQLGFVEWPGGMISPGMTIVRAGQLVDDRSAVARHAPRGALRRSTRAERRAAAAGPAAPEPPSVGLRTGYLEDD